MCGHIDLAEYLLLAVVAWPATNSLVQWMYWCISREARPCECSHGIYCQTLDTWCCRQIEHNAFSGSLSPAFSELQSLVLFSAGSNKLTGVLPTFSDSVSFLMLPSNKFRGALPRLPKYIQTLLLHSNQFTGQLRSLQPYRKLTNLTLFGNRFQGACAQCSDPLTCIGITHLWQGVCSYHQVSI